ncbi:gamma-glutamylcyclotransferase family protein [Pedobacter hiemivivus]|uniref:Gamma-glutamylcyclotransferase n=1 Tax=Pedobacter hiemivivus TaxID=2530454 RepID=A0A4R0NE66_9SPHI|nr:gamma-glutamylcyclotransferase family protein [Pedobacter hiemivivus]TCC98720.1 gamma-glutamylcyclotransferase [Pedobacter hiemivivus]
MNEYLFSYGTLQKDKVQLETFGRLLKGSKDTLNGYKLSTIVIVDEDVLATSGQEIHLLAIPSEIPNDRIDGVIFEITDKELLAADGYETDAYQRVKLQFESGKEAWIYIAS